MDDKFRKPSRRTSGKHKGGNNAKTALIASLVLAVAIIIVGIVMHNNANDDKETAEYSYAINSYEPLILSHYLDQYKDAPAEHRDAIASRLKMIETMESEWKKAESSGSADSLRLFIGKYPDSKHRKEALQMTDSLDFIRSQAADTEEAYLDYLDSHADGAYYENAHEALRRLKAKEVTTEENIMIANIMRSLLLSVNMNDESGLMAIAAENLTLLDNEDATRGDMSDFLHKLYKADVSNIEWTSTSEYNISKREIGDFDYEYSVIFTLKSTITHTEGSQTTSHLRLNATVNPDGLISQLRLTRIAE